ncbi:MAG: HEAT repeat domain-containing protein [Pseudomonadota bacterium]
MLSKEDVIAEMDHRSQKLITEGCFDLQSKYPLEVWMPAFIKALPEMKNAMSRKYVLHFATRHHDDYPEIIPAARNALNDKSWLVREDALGVLAYACDQKSIEFIAPLLNHSDSRTRECAERAIKAIRERNRNFFLSPDGSAVWV